MKYKRKCYSGNSKNMFHEKNNWISNVKRKQNHWNNLNSKSLIKNTNFFSSKHAIINTKTLATIWKKIGLSFIHLKLAVFIIAKIYVMYCLKYNKMLDIW